MAQSTTVSSLVLEFPVLHKYTEKWLISEGKACQFNLKDSCRQKNKWKMNFLFGLVQTTPLHPAVISSVSLFNSACFHHDASTADRVSHRWSVCHTVFCTSCFLQASNDLQSNLSAFVLKFCSLIQLWLKQISLACCCRLTCFKESVAFWVAAGFTGKKICRVVGSTCLDRLTLGN